MFTPDIPIVQLVPRQAGPLCFIGKTVLRSKRFRLYQSKQIRDVGLFESVWNLVKTR